MARRMIDRLISASKKRDITRFAGSITDFHFRDYGLLFVFHGDFLFNFQYLRDMFSKLHFPMKCSLFYISARDRSFGKKSGAASRQPPG